MITLFEWIFWGLIVLNLYIFAGYLLILKLLSFRLRYRFTGKIQSTPSVTLLISAYNEEASIREKLENSLRLEYQDLQIVVSSDGSTDRTVEIAREYGDRGVTVYEYEKNRGKGTAINDTMRKIDSEIVVLSDANAMYKPDAIGRLVERFTDTVGCVVGELIFQNIQKSATGEGELVYWRYENRIKEYESRFGKLLVANGAINAIRRSLFRDLCPGIADDFQIPIDIAAQNYAVVFEPSARAYEKTASDLVDEFRRKVRIVNRGLFGFKILRREITGFRLFQFISHKWLRWLLGAWAALLYCSNTMLVTYGSFSPFYTAFFLLQNLFYLLAAIGFLYRNRPGLPNLLYIPTHFCVVNIAGLVAFWKHFRGQRFVSWEKPESAR